MVQSLYSWMHYGQRPRKRREEKKGERECVCVCVCVCVTLSTKKGCLYERYTVIPNDNTSDNSNVTVILDENNNDNNNVFFYVLFLQVGAHSSLQNKEQSIKTHACPLSVGQLEEVRFQR